MAAARQAIDAEVASRLDEERGKIAAAEAQKAKRLVATDLEARAKEIADLTEVLKQRDAKLAEAQQAQADLIRKQRDLDDAKREIDLTIQKQVQAELTAVRDQAKQETEAALTLRVREKEEQIASMQRQIEDLKRKAEQGSQQLQGEVQELALEALLRQRFARDLIEPIPKGEFGGDLIQRVVGPAGQVVGSILWEAKRTKNWSDGWLGKLREDQRAAKADVALIVSQALPKGVQTFDYIDGVWVTEPKCAVAVAVALRESLIALSAARLAVGVPRPPHEAGSPVLGTRYRLELYFDETVFDATAVAKEQRKSGLPRLLEDFEFGRHRLVLLDRPFRVSPPSESCRPSLGDCPDRVGLETGFVRHRHCLHQAKHRSCGKNSLHWGTIDLNAQVVAHALQLALKSVRREEAWRMAFSI